MITKQEKDPLVKEMNELSDVTGLSEEQRLKNKERMVEIAKILLADHYGYSRKKD